MPLPKRLAEALATVKELPDEIRDALNGGVFFDNEGQFLASVEQKTKVKLTEAERKAKEGEKAAREKAVAEVCEKLGVTDPDEIDAIKAKLAEAAGQLNEVEKLRGSLTKAERDLVKANEENVALKTFRVAVVKDRAISPHIDKVHPDLRETVRENLVPKLVVNEKTDQALAPDGKDVGAYIDEMLKAKPLMRAPEYKPGAGSGPTGGKVEIPVAARPATPAAPAAAPAAQPVPGPASAPSSFNGTREDAAKLIGQILREKAEPTPAPSAGP